MNDNKKDVVFYGCVTLVILTWAITGFVIDLKQTEAKRQVDIEAIKNGYIECVTSRQESVITKLLWKKDCKE